MARMPYPDTDATKKAATAYRDAIAAHQVAAAEYAQLRAKVEDGAEIEPTALTEAAAKAEHAELRIEAKHRALANSRLRARKASMTELALEICDYDTDSIVKGVLADFTQIEQAFNELLKRVRTHNAKVSEWRQWAGDLHAHHEDYSSMPPDCNAGVGVPTNIGAPNGIQHDGEMICHLDPAAALMEIVEALHRAAASNDEVDLTHRAKAIARQAVHVVSNSGRTGDWITAAHFREGS